MIEREFGAMDLDRVLKNADAQMARIGDLREVLTELVGRAADRDGLVQVEMGNAGLRSLQLHPKAMRRTSGELAELIQAVIAEAADDLRRKVTESMQELFGDENPMRFADDPDGPMAQVREAEAAYNRTFDDLMGELDQIRNRMER
ncbi:YbaB/EbfC family nucleoid-associated protein [Nonomuraea sp. ZG12]|jgi:DNA-binding protein YbaB|uniref:YbaB/EbfC family nucleoid-associated protein n=1 Tax=Nonomuraea sp. ZG12 TaxID=3452207 RepID=UPI003F8B508F